MPLVGGGGSPNVSGGNPSGTGGSINYIGNHCYAHSGLVTVSDSSFTSLMKFDTTNAYIIATVSIHTAANSTNNNDWRFKINDEIVVATEFDNTRSEQFPSFARAVTILIPPFSKFELQCQMTTGPQDWTAILKGDVYA